MSEFNSITHAKKCLTLAKNKIDKILNTDLSLVDEKHRTIEMWYKTIGLLPEYAEKRKKMKQLEKDFLDAEIYVICARSTVVLKKTLFDTCS